MIVKSPRLLYIASLMLTLQKNKIYHQNHWDEIIPGQLVLGAIPSKQHAKILSKKTEDGGLGVTSIVTLLQEHELVSSIFYQPATKEDWSNVGVDYLWIITEDYEPVKPSELIRGADYIHEQVRIIF